MHSVKRIYITCMYGYMCDCMHVCIGCWKWEGEGIPNDFQVFYTACLIHSLPIHQFWQHTNTQVEPMLWQRDDKLDFSHFKFKACIRHSTGDTPWFSRNLEFRTGRQTTYKRLRGIVIYLVTKATGRWDIIYGIYRMRIDRRWFRIDPYNNSNT